MHKPATAPDDESGIDAKQGLRSNVRNPTAEIAGRDNDAAWRFASVKICRRREGAAECGA